MPKSTIDPTTWNRSHQTLTVIDVASSPSKEYQERIKRLNESLNEENIKTDIVSASDGELRSGIVFEGDAPGKAGSKITQLAKGYVMVIRVSEGIATDDEEF